jgi:HEAT repeat protein
LIWALSNHPNGPPFSLSDEELTVLWNNLAGDDARKAHQAIWKLQTDSMSTVPFLRIHLTPTAVPNPKQVARLIADLDSDEFALRESATAELGKFGSTVETSLRNKLAEKPSPELRRRIEQLLRRKEDLSAESLRALRAVEVLEHIGTSEAKRVLQTLAKGATGSRLTTEAQASFDRLNPD